MEASARRWALPLLLLLLLPPPSQAPSCTPASVPEVLYNWSSQHCSDILPYRRDLPDATIGAWLDRTRGRPTPIAVAGGRRGTYLNLNYTGHDCDHVVFNVSDASPSPRSFTNNQWIFAPYVLHDDARSGSSGGSTVVALLHNEYHGWEHDATSGCNVTKKQNTGPASCSWNSISLALSTDGGRHFAHSSAPPSNLVAASPFRFEPDAPKFGFGCPSHIVRSPKDGYYYSLFQHFPANNTVDGSGKIGYKGLGSCLVRTATLQDPTSWRYYNSSGGGGGPAGSRGAFTGRFINPYTSTASLAEREAMVCPNLEGVSAFSPGCGPMIKWSSFFERFIVIGIAHGVPAEGHSSFAFALSDDLIQWEAPVAIRELDDNHTAHESSIYVTLLPPASDVLEGKTGSDNFDVVGEVAELHWVHQSARSSVVGRGELPIKRDVLRQLVRFAK